MQKTLRTASIGEPAQFLHAARKLFCGRRDMEHRPVVPEHLDAIFLWCLEPSGIRGSPEIVHRHPSVDLAEELWRQLSIAYRAASFIAYRNGWP